MAQWWFCVWDSEEAELVLVTVALPGARFRGLDLDLFGLVHIPTGLVARQGVCAKSWQLDRARELEGAAVLAIKGHTLGGAFSRTVVDPVAIGALDLVGSNGGRVEQLPQVWSIRWCQF